MSMSKPSRSSSSKPAPFCAHLQGQPDPQRGRGCSRCCVNLIGLRPCSALPRPRLRRRWSRPGRDRPRLWRHAAPRATWVAASQHGWQQTPQRTWEHAGAAACWAGWLWAAGQQAALHSRPVSRVLHTRWARHMPRAHAVQEPALGGSPVAAGPAQRHASSSAACTSRRRPVSRGLHLPHCLCGWRWREAELRPARTPAISPGNQPWHSRAPGAGPPAALGLPGLVAGVVRGQGVQQAPERVRPAGRQLPALLL